MRKLALLVGGLVVLVGLSAIVARVTTAQVNSNDPNVAMVDNCDPTTFNAAIGPGTCAATPHEHDTTFAEFIGLLFSPLAANVIGHPAWSFAPGYISIRAGQTVRAINAGGESHTFTEVTAFGGGVVPVLNGVGPRGNGTVGFRGGMLLFDDGAIRRSRSGHRTGGRSAQVSVLHPPMDARGS